MHCLLVGERAIVNLSARLQGSLEQSDEFRRPTCLLAVASQHPDKWNWADSDAPIHVSTPIGITKPSLGTTPSRVVPLSLWAQLRVVHRRCCDRWTSQDGSLAVVGTPQ